MKSKKTYAADPWSDMDRLVVTESEPTGPEWFTTTEFGRRYSMCRIAASNRLNIMADRGLVEKWKGRTVGYSAIRCKYRLTAKGRKAA